MTHSHIWPPARLNPQARLFSVVGAFILGVAAFSSAQAKLEAGTAQSSHPPAGISAPHQVVVAGCLRRDSNGAYSISGESGKTFALIAGSENVDLSKHVFHAVRITGKEAPNTKASASDEEPQGQSSPAPVLRVLTLEVLSNSCTR